MAKKISDLEKDIYILEAQKRVVIAHNPSTSTFEYIGDPMPIGDKEVTRIDDIIKNINTRKYLKKKKHWSSLSGLVHCTGKNYLISLQFTI